MFYWKCESNDDAFNDKSAIGFQTKKEAYDDMRKWALEKMKWNTEYDEDFEEETEIIEYQVKFSKNKIVHESYSGIYTYEIYEK